MEKIITVLTATYNRAHLLPDLYHSLCRQTNPNFDWVIVDDGSNDGTEELFNKWTSEEHSFHIKYLKKTNGGKNLAINDGVKVTKTPFVMIVDSDDFLTDDAIEFLSLRAKDTLLDQEIAGISGLKGNENKSPLGIPHFKENEFIVCNNLERKKYGLEKDACEVYKTSILQSHPFVVWEEEKFSPEEIVWDTIALEGLSLKWYNKVTMIIRYQENGLTKNSFSLMRKNPMGYAMLYKHRVQLSKKKGDKIYWNCQLFANSIIAKNLSYGFEDNLTFYSIISLPLGAILAIRRKLQFRI